MLDMELCDSSRQNTFLKLGVESSFSENFPSMEASNFWVSPTLIESVDPCILTISWFPVMVRKTLVPPIRTGPFTVPETFPSRDVVPSLPVLLTYLRGFWRVCALLCAASVMTGFFVRCHVLMRIPSTSCNPICNMRIKCVVMIRRVLLINNFVANFRC